MKEEVKGQSKRRRWDNGSRGGGGARTEAEGCRPPLEAGKVKEMDSPLEPPG